MMLLKDELAMTDYVEARIIVCVKFIRRAACIIDRFMLLLIGLVIVIRSCELTQVRRSVQRRGQQVECLGSGGCGLARRLHRKGRSDLLVLGRRMSHVGAARRIRAREHSSPTLGLMYMLFAGRLYYNQQREEIISINMIECLQTPFNTKRILSSWIGEQ